MRVTKVLSAQALRLAVIESHVYLPDFIKALQRRYGFVRAPQKADELLSSKGRPMVFEHGKFTHDSRTIMIDSLNIYSHIVTLDTGTTTDDADLVLDDVLREHSETIEERPGGLRAYMSDLEVALEVSLDRISPVSGPMGQAIAALLRTYGEENPPPLQVETFSMLVDPQRHSLPCEFKIERRAGSPYDANVYFSQAPLRTADHAVMLQEFERRMAGPARTDL